ncbi:MAG: signal recognition particle protein [Candidatus Eisenbacteria sp.]|nr:signal recognition particle protein [Candidatus Eisenbacteria bacterium]
MFEDLGEKLNRSFKGLLGRGKLSEKNIESGLREIRRSLLEADVHYKVAKDFIQVVKERSVGQEVLGNLRPGQQVVRIVHEELVRLMGSAFTDISRSRSAPTVILLVGLQGSGKTTFAAKLARRFQKSGQQPLLVAGDTARPAAVEQLKILGSEIDVRVFEKGSGADPVEVAAEGVREARRLNFPVVIVDSRGRLHVDGELMEELRKTRDAIAPQETLLVVDGMSGQDAARVARSFADDLGIDGVVLTKLDGDARGGAALSVRAVSGKPIKFVSVGEKVDQLEPFHPDRMASRILGMGDVLTLAEKAQEVFDRKQTEKMERKIREASFTLEDFRDQLRQVKKLGSLDDLAQMIPGMGRVKGLEAEEGRLTAIEAMINSMTPEERRIPRIIDGSRRKRISRGSGTQVKDVNRLLKEFEQVQKLMKTMRKRGPFRMPMSLG